jgi:hypothetical protein
MTADASGGRGRQGRRPRPFPQRVAASGHVAAANDAVTDFAVDIVTLHWVALP